MNINAKNLILLTGAGFSKNFGGFLGSEMWSFIFNHPLIQQNKDLKELMANVFNYEWAYNMVLTGDSYTEDDMQAMQTAVEDAYKSLDDVLKKWVYNDNNPNALNIYGLRNFLTLFSGAGSEQGFIFTLNQDVLMERQFNHTSLAMTRFFTAPIGDFTREYFRTTTDVDTLQSITDLATYGNLLYIKLHGSYGWLSADGSSQMVIGANKREYINKEPLLKWYFDILQNIISKGDVKIVIVGYSFSDDHVNDVLLAGAREHNLSLYVINPTDPITFRGNMEKKFKDDFKIFWQSISGYFPYSLMDIFPHDQNQHPTPLFDNIKRAITS